MKALNRFLSEVIRPNLGPLVALSKIADGRTEEVRDGADAQAAIRLMRDGTNDRKVLCHVASGLAEEGPKVVSLKADEADALRRVRMTVPWGEYRQPFRTLCIDLPPQVFAGALPAREAGNGPPTAIVFRAPDEALQWGMVVLFDKQGYMSLSGTGARGQMVEDLTPGRCQSLDEHEPSEEEAKTVAEIANECRRIAMNAAMLVSSFGSEIVARPAALKVGKKASPAARAAAELTHRLSPVVYRINQSVKLYDREGPEPGEPGGPAGREVSPHWRRGHWADVPCGAGRAQRRRVFRRPCLVRADRFGGSPLDCTTTYTV